jgi:hypothetical protein
MKQRSLMAVMGTVVDNSRYLSGLGDTFTQTLRSQAASVAAAMIAHRFNDHGLDSKITDSKDHALARCEAGHMRSPGLELSSCTWRYLRASQLNLPAGSADRVNGW